jgi:hypothetical protein
MAKRPPDVSGKSRARAGQDKVLEAATDKRSWFERLWHWRREVTGKPSPPYDREREQRR